MKNLTVTEHSGRSLQSLPDEIPTNLNQSKILHTINLSNNDVYLLVNSKLSKIPLNCEKNIISFDVDENLEFVSLEYSSLSQELYGACKSGDIMRISIESEFKCELVSQLNVNLQCMKLSPDHEMIILVTDNGIVITMVSSFQVISEVDLHTSDFGQKQFVTVGWGKKETQFHGSEGKGAAKAKPMDMYINDLDDGLCRISWREDGSFFAVGFLHCQDKTRQFKIFDREGTLQYTGELTNSLEESLSWKPSGSLIALTQKLPNKHIVALFEMNGLKHREFSLPFEPNEIVVKDLFWSPDSEILTIWCQIQKDSSSVLQLWTETNYHWYLKQTIKFSVENPLICATWSTASWSKKLILVTCKEIFVYDYNWSVSHSRGKSIHDKSVVGVIDGNKLLITGLRKGIVPPPMAHQTVVTSESINAIVFAPDIDSKDSWIDSNAFFCVTDSNKLIFYKYVTDSCTVEYECIGSYDIKWNLPVELPDFRYCMHHFLWIDENHVLCSLSKINHNLICILTLHEINERNQGQVIAKETHVMDGSIRHIVPTPCSKAAYIIVDNSVLKYTSDAELIPTDIKLQHNTYKIEIVKIGTKDVMVSLFDRNSFGINGRQIANNITSFFIHSEFLLLTTLQHTLICIVLSEEGLVELAKMDLTVKLWENHTDKKSSTNLNVRRIERGSQLIMAIAKDSKTILQMPRGNLECIQPRALSLYIVGFYLNNCDYLLAFDLMRRQRINLNLICDHDPKKFMEHADKFIDQVSKPSWLSLLLSELQDEDVTQTIYRNYYWKDQATTNTVAANKVELFCTLLRNIMEKKDNANHYIQPILISLVKDRRQQGLEAALNKVKEIRKSEGSSEDTERITTDEALKYLLYIVDVNVLFDTALGMYDFDLTMFIASKSQKDPKEYIPFLNELKKLDENYMKYSIDLHLKRYESALEHIAKEPTRFNECINFICNHDLYAKALKLFEKNSAEYKEIAMIYGEFLLKNKQYQEAGIMFHKGGNFKEALNAYKLAGSWQEAVVLSIQMELSETEKHVLYRELVERLKAYRRYEETAHILINYLKDTEEAIISLCSGRHWKDAIRIAYDTQRLNLIESRIKVSVLEYADHVMSQIQMNKQNFEQYRTRLATVRLNILQRSVKSYDGIMWDSESIHDTGISDILSDTSSDTSTTCSQKSKFTLSGKSYRSSKNRRKHERKLLSLKKGSPFEVLALIQALYQIISNTYKEKDNLQALIQMLVYFDEDEYAEKMQRYMEQFIFSIEGSKSEIWDKSALSSLTEMESTQVSMLKESQGSSISQQIIESSVVRPPATNSVPWKLNIF